MIANLSDKLIMLSERLDAVERLSNRYDDNFMVESHSPLLLLWRDRSNTNRKAMKINSDFSLNCTNLTIHVLFNPSLC